MNIDVGHDDVKCVDDCKDSNICKFSGSHSKYDRKNKIFLTAIHISNFPSDIFPCTKQYVLTYSMEQSPS